MSYEFIFLKNNNRKFRYIIKLYLFYKLLQKILISKPKLGDELWMYLSRKTPPTISIAAEMMRYLRIINMAYYLVSCKKNYICCGKKHPILQRYIDRGEYDHNIECIPFLSLDS